MPIDDPSHGPEGQALRDAAQAIALPLWTTDADGSCDFLSASWLAFTGADADEHRGWNWIDAVHPEDRPRLADRWTAALGSGEPMTGEYRIRRHDGTHRWFDVRAGAGRDAGGRIVRWYLTATDVDELHHLRRALRERDGQLSAALAAGGMARFVYDLEARRFTSDEALLRLLELPRAAVASEGMEGWADHIHADDRPAWHAAMRRAMEPDGHREYDVRYRLVVSPERTIWIGSRGRVEFDDQGKPRSIAGVVFPLRRLDDGIPLDPRD